MVKQSSADMQELTRQTGVSPVLARILAVRGMRTAEQIDAFLHAEQRPLADPFLFADMLPAVEIAAAAIEDGELCAVFGDYDADGVMSTLIVLTTLRQLGGNAIYYIPHREDEGYGLNNEAISTLHQQGVSVLFACDNGISAVEQVAYANQLGMTVVILDHHAVTIGEDGRQILPAAEAVVDAKRGDCQYPFKELCAAGVCYRFSEALYQYVEKDWTSLGQSLLPFATIATVCDLVELHEENRTLVKRGLPQLTALPNCGLQALISAVGLQGKAIDAYHVGFIIGPCINASGRLDIADLAVELFLTEDPQQAQALAQQLVELNRQRRKLTEDGAQIAAALLEQQQLHKDKVIVLHSTQIQESVAGIVAGRIKERYYRPTIMLVGSGEVVRGSCRSIDAYNIYQGLYGCRQLLRTFGGHPMAAGLSIAAADIPALRRLINEQSELSEEQLQPTHRIDCPLELGRANYELACLLRQLAPFGKGNAKPLFAAKGLVVQRISLLGKEGQVVRWSLRQADGNVREATDFGGRSRAEAFIQANYPDGTWDGLLSGKGSYPVTLDIVYNLCLNQYNGRESEQIQIVDYRPAQ